MEKKLDHKTKLGSGKRKKPQEGKISKKGFGKTSEDRDMMEKSNKALGVNKNKKRKI